MTQTLEIRFLGMEVAEAVAMEPKVRAGAAMLQACKELHACCVAVERLPVRPPSGQPYAVRIDARLGGKDVTVSRLSEDNPDAALHRAFDGMVLRWRDLSTAQA